MVVETAQFTRSLPVRGDFRSVLEEHAYQRVPDDWLIALSDVVASRKAIAAGRYKAVNLSGAAIISALMNALDTQDLPYIFSGDGSAVICAPADRATVEETLASTAAWVRDELDLTLRTALVPVAEVRARGFDLRVQATRVSEAITNYAFSGGGVSEAERLMKAGAFAVAPAAPGSLPDLTGLSCRWSPIRQTGRSIVSVIVEAGANAGDGFHDIAERVLDLAGLGLGDRGSPVPTTGPTFGVPMESINIEVTQTKGGSRLLRKAWLVGATLLAWAVLRFNIPLGSFDPRRYKEFTSLNTDYRKFQDGLRVTVSLGKAELEGLTDYLERERQAKNLRYGLCVQDSAILTCYVPSVTSDAHFHFLDGAGGGYAQAAENMKQ